MRLTGSGAYSRAAPVPRMPPGLVELMEGLSKDVLRNNPTNIYEFCANHMEKLIEIRDGPSRKKTLTLEEKIAIAQKKVRQRAKEEQQRYDNEMLRAATTQAEIDETQPEIDDTQPEINETQTENDKTPPEKDDSDHEVTNVSRELLKLRSPVHHDQDLSHASEVEISHEPSTDNSLTSKDFVIEADENPISKSSTVSSISKSTVIDLLSNDQEITNKEDKEDDNDLNLLKEGVAQEEKPDETSIKSIKSHISDAIDQNVLIETNIIPDEEISAKELDVDLKEEIDNENDTLEKSKSVNLDSESQIVDSGTVSDNMDTSIVVSEILLQHTEPELVETAILKDSVSSEPIESQMDDHTNLDDTNAEVSMKSISNVTNEKISNDQIAEEAVEERLPAKTVSTLDDSSLKDSDNNLISQVLSSSDITISNSNTNKHPIQTVDESNDEVTANIGYGQSDVIEIAEIHKEIEKETEAQDQISDENKSTPEIFTKNMDQLENHSTSIENQNEVYIKDIKIESEQNINKQDVEVAVNEASTLNNDTRQSAGNDGDIVKEDKEDKTKDENEKTTLILNPDSVHNDQINVSIGIDAGVPKAEEDVPQNDNENLQNNMDLETAAVTIQKVFRSFLFKSRNSTFEDITNDEAISMDEDNDKKEEYYAAAAAANLSQDRRPLGLTRMDTVLQTVNEEKSLSLSTDDSSTLSSAATTIQAHVRGFLVRNRLNSYKTVSTNSLVNSNEMLDTDSDQKSKTVLNIHIVPEQANYLSRDESLITSMDLSLDGSPPSSVNLHPLSYDLVSERRKLLKREDAIQSVSPPSNNSGKLSEDSVKEVLVNENDATKLNSNIHNKEDQPNADDNSGSILTAVADVTVDDASNEPVDVEIIVEKRKSPMSPDESDVVTPFAASPHSVGDYKNTSRLLHSGEFHDVLLPTKVSRSDTTVVREFKNVLAYILLWNAS